MLAYDDLRTGFRPFFRRARAARLDLAGAMAELSDIGEPAAFRDGARPLRTRRSRRPATRASCAASATSSAGG